MGRYRKLIITLIILSVIVSGYAALAATPTASTMPSTTPKPTTASKPVPAAAVTGSISGTIYDAANNLVPDADVYLKDKSGTIMGLTLTDGNGTYAFTELSAENHTVLVQVDGHSWFSKTTVKSGNATVVDVHIPDYYHWPEVTPWPTPVSVSDNSSKPGSTKVATATPKPVLPPANTSISVTPVPGVQNETSEQESGGSPIDDLINGIVGFFKSIFGM